MHVPLAPADQAAQTVAKSSTGHDCCKAHSKTTARCIQKQSMNKNSVNDQTLRHFGLSCSARFLSKNNKQDELRASS
jgi:hypothetical protein